MLSSLVKFLMFLMCSIILKPGNNASFVDDQGKFLCGAKKKILNNEDADMLEGNFFYEENMAVDLHSVDYQSSKNALNYIGGHIIKQIKKKINSPKITGTIFERIFPKIYHMTAKFYLSEAIAGTFTKSNNMMNIVIDMYAKLRKYRQIFVMNKNIIGNIYIYVYIHIHIYIHLNIYISICIYTYICMSISR